MKPVRGVHADASVADVHHDDEAEERRVEPLTHVEAGHGERHVVDAGEGHHDRSSGFRGVVAPGTALVPGYHRERSGVTGIHTRKAQPGHRASLPRISRMFCDVRMGTTSGCGTFRQRCRRGADARVGETPGPEALTGRDRELDEIRPAPGRRAFRTSRRPAADRRGGNRQDGAPARGATVGGRLHVPDRLGRRVGVRLAHAGLLELLTPLRSLLPGVPRGQAAALESALGWSSSDAPADRFLVAAGTLSLLAAASAEEPVLVLVDDFQWLDRESAGAIAFAARRLGADPVGFLMNARTDSATLAPTSRAACPPWPCTRWRPRTRQPSWRRR